MFELKEDKWKLMRDLLFKIMAQMDLFTMQNLLKGSFTKKKANRMFKMKQKVANQNR